MSAEDRVRYWRDRARTAERLEQWEKENADHQLKWFNERISRERMLMDRCTYLYGLAATLGATPEQLAEARRASE